MSTVILRKWQLRFGLNSRSVSLKKKKKTLDGSFSPSLCILFFSFHAFLVRIFALVCSFNCIFGDRCTAVNDVERVALYSSYSVVYYLFFPCVCAFVFACLYPSHSSLSSHTLKVLFLFLFHLPCRYKFIVLCVCMCVLTL